MTGAEDILMIPDPSTFRVLPWSTHCGWLLADLHHPDGRPAKLSTRGILKEAVQRLDAAGYRFMAGLEMEFHVLRVIDQRLAHADTGQPAAAPETVH